MARNSLRKGARKTANKTSISVHPALENLKERLSSPRLKAASTIGTYLQTGTRLLSGLGKDREPTENDFRRYFIRRRRQGISESTRHKEFFHLKKLAIANNWTWPFETEGVPAIAVSRKRTTKALATVNKAVNILHPALKNLVERLSSSQLGAPSTLDSYLVTCTNFLSVLKDDQSPTDSDFRRYFIQRRRQRISENTLRKEFFHLKKLAIANGWPWPFESDDAPNPEQERKLPAFSRSDIARLIKARAKLSKAERFYLAVATTWIVRREDLSNVKKRDYDGSVFTIYHSKHGRKITHLIPDDLRAIFADYRPKEHSSSALSLMFRRICAKAGLQQKRGSGWDGIESRLHTLLKDGILQNRLDPSLLSDYTHRKQSAGGRQANDEYGIDRVIYGIHPFLPLW